MLTVGLVTSIMALVGVPFMASQKTKHMMLGAGLTLPFIVFMGLLTFVWR